MDVFPLPALPDEIQALVAKRVAANSVADLYRLRATCKSMKELTNRPGIYASVDVFTFPRNVFHRQYEVMEVCYANGNPSALLLKGVQLFFIFDQQDEGLSLIKRAADAGYERAMYIYAMARKVFWNDEEYFSRFTRESVQRIGNNVREFGWGTCDNDALITKKYQFMWKELPLFYNCQCTPVLNRDWDLWFIEDSKDNKMCDRCLWIKEVALFYRDFRAVVSFVDCRCWVDVISIKS